MTGPISVLPRKTSNDLEPATDLGFVKFLAIQCSVSSVSIALRSSPEDLTISDRSPVSLLLETLFERVLLALVGLVLPVLLSSRQKASGLGNVCSSAKKPLSSMTVSRSTYRSRREVVDMIIHVRC